MADVETQNKWVYLIREGNGDMEDLLGGKGAGLAEMTRAQLPVPPGFIVTTRACNSYNRMGGEFPQGMWHQVIEGMRDLEVQTDKVFGEPSNPLLVSVRSGARVSMPGMMDTILDLGLNDDTVNGLSQASGGKRFAYDSYRRFIQMFGKVVLDIPNEDFEIILDEYKNRVGVSADSEISAEGWKEMVAEFKALVRKETHKEFPQDPYEQLRLAVKAVFDSWNGKPAVDYRNFYGIPHDLGTAVNVLAMVFGNMDENSGTGVVFTRDPSTGEKHLYGEYLFNAQGEDVVAGVRTPQNIAQLAQASPELYRQLDEIAQRLETRYLDAQDMEFTIERGVLYMLQTRSAKRTAQAAVKMAVDMTAEGLITKEEALKRVEPSQIDQLLLPRFDEKAKAQVAANGDLLATGLNASPGAASGKVVFDPDRAQELGGHGEEVILVRTETSPDDVHGMLNSKGVLTSRGGATSHAAVVARGLGKPCIAGCEALVVDMDANQCNIDGRVIEELEEISIDGTTGEVFFGRVPTRDPNDDEKRELNTLLGWADEVRKLGVWTNADTPEDAQRGLDFGAEGIGLCRTEHMFFAEDRLPFVQQMILAASEAAGLEDLLRKVEEETRAVSARRRPQQEVKLQEQSADVAASPAVQRYREALARLLEFQTEDFTAILRVMTGKPVIIRLLDPPLHEFLPRHEDLLREVIELRGSDGDEVVQRDKEQLLDAVESLREANPMLGLRGCRLGIMYEAINEMQARAIMTAACDLAKEGWDPRPEIMVPLVSHPNELSLVRRIIERVLEEVQREKGVEVPYKIGTMIELPRAALTADKIAEHAEFFSFGTNDLTQTTYGFSRDDAEGKFLRHYVEWGILPENPFQVLDRDGVGELVKLGFDRGRSTKPDLEVGICGEHGGDPTSIQFCHQVGLNYVSASPFRVPVARLAAAQAALDSQEE